MKTKLFFIFVLVLNISFSQTDIEYLFSADTQNVSQEGDEINYSFHVIPYGSDSYSQMNFSNTYGLDNLQYVSGDSNNNSLIETGEDWLYTITHTVTQDEINNNGLPSNSGVISYELTFVIEKPNGEAFIYYVLEDVAINTSTYLIDDVFCADNPNNSLDVDLSYKNTEVLNGDSASDFTISYFINNADAMANVNALQNINSFWDAMVVYVRKENNNTSDFEILFYTITINEFVYAIEPTSLVNCEDNFVFNLFSKNQEIIGNQTNINVSYHLTQVDAENNVNSLPNFYTINNSQLIFVNVTSQITGCTNTTSLLLEFIECEVSYTTEPLPYQLYNTDFTGQTINTDDRFSQTIDISFNFSFFENEYSNLSIGDNGVISFDQEDVGVFCEWNLSEEEIPNAGIIDNAIFGIYQDIWNPNEVGTLGFGITGVSPFRKFIAIYEHMPLYGCQDIFVTNQVILYETYNFIDVQVKDRNVCTTWNNGRAILGIQNIGGTEAYFPENRNTGNWEAHDEGWRFRPQHEHPEFQYILCDANVDGVEIFEKNVIIDYFNEDNGNVYSFYYTLTEAENDVNSIFGNNFVNTSNTQTIFVREIDNVTGEVTIHNILLAAIDCSNDYDLDNVPTIDEDLNGNGNFGDDDTDGDAIPDFIDEDDDGDYVLTNVEAINTRNPEDGYLDTDGDNIPDYLDNDDDGDNISTLDEDVNGNYNPLDDDSDGDNIPDYLDHNALSVYENILNSFILYPNPVKNILTLELIDLQTNLSFTIYNLSGSILYKRKVIQDLKTAINISNLSSGVYFIKLENDNQNVIRKFVKE